MGIQKAVLESVENQWWTHFQSQTLGSSFLSPTWGFQDHHNGAQSVKGHTLGVATTQEQHSPDRKRDQAEDQRVAAQSEHTIHQQDPEDTHSRTREIGE